MAQLPRKVGLAFLLILLSLLLAGSTIAQEGEKWCSTQPTAIRAGFLEWNVFFPPETNLGNLAGSDYYFYHNGQYVGPYALQLEELDSEMDAWRARLNPLWVFGFDEETGEFSFKRIKFDALFPTSWRVDYRC
jgi:hypothetical protein